MGPSVIQILVKWWAAWILHLLFIKFKKKKNQRSRLKVITGMIVRPLSFLMKILEIKNIRLLIPFRLKFIWMIRSKVTSIGALVSVYKLNLRFMMKNFSITHSIQIDRIINSKPRRMNWWIISIQALWIPIETHFMITTIWIMIMNLIQNMLITTCLNKNFTKNSLKRYNIENFI